jgi:hypothetical protein
MAPHHLITLPHRRLFLKPTIKLFVAGLISLAMLTGLGCSAVQSDPTQENSVLAESPEPRPESTSTDGSSTMPSTQLGQQLPISAVAEIAGQDILLEVAQTPRQQAMGLMFRDPLPNNRGMLFPLGRPRPVSFWMKNVPVPLDMVFIYNGTIQAISENVPPCTADPCPTYGPGNQLIDHVIELRGGHAAELGLAPGDEVIFSPVKHP